MSDPLQFDKNLKNYLLEIAKWSRFLGIIGYIGVGLLILISFFIGSFLNLLPLSELHTVPVSTLSIVYFILAGIYFFPINYLFQFSKNLRISLETENQDSLETAFKNLKSHYKFIGMFVAVIISMYAVLFLGAILRFIF